MQSMNRTVSRRGFLTTAAACAATTFGPSRKTRALASDLQGKPARLRAGAATSDVTPKQGVVLDGTIMQIGPATAVHDPLNARALVLDDGAERLAISTADCTMASRDVFRRAKQLVHEKTGLPRDRMLFAGTHSHSAVRAIGIGQGPLDIEYLELLAQGIAKAVCRAIDNLAPARVGWGVGQKPELVYNRRWFMKPGKIPPNPFGQKGEKVKMNPRRGSPDLDKPAGPVPGISIAVIRRIPECGNAIFIGISQNPIVRNIAPEQEIAGS